MTSQDRSGLVRAMLRFFELEASSGIALLTATVMAFVWANMNPGGYEGFFTPAARHFINDGLMTLFFFIVALEIKRELVEGELRDRRAALLPVLAAIGGMLVPAALYLVIAPAGEAGRGWGIPVATDIAFAVGVLALLGHRVSSGTKLFLLSFAIADDIGAILVIAVFYARDISFPWIGVALAGLVLVWFALRADLRSLVWFVPLGLAVWFATDRSGVHATIAGVALGFLVPASSRHGESLAPSSRLENALAPWTAHLVVPVFALANAGIVLRGETLAFPPLAWAVAVGLVAGKAIGIFSFTWLIVRTRLADLPRGMSPGHLLGVALLGGVGFTVSLFVAGLAFEDAALFNDARLGIFAGSIVAAVLGYLLLRVASKGN
ncbi:Na+/H+ antiporter NhaA [soil metagenome]